MGVLFVPVSFSDDTYDPQTRDSCRLKTMIDTFQRERIEELENANMILQEYIKLIEEYVNLKKEHIILTKKYSASEAK
jgi:hypothetical protein